MMMNAEPFGLADVEDRDDVGVAQRGDRLRLSPEALQQLGRETEVGAEHLHGEIALEAEVARPEHLGKSARADPLAEFVVGAERALQLARQVGRPDAGRRRSATICPVSRWIPGGVAVPQT